MLKRQISEQLIAFTGASPSVFHAVENIAVRLKNQGYTQLYEEQAWNVSPRGKYFVTRNGSSLLAFRLHGGEVQSEVRPFNIAAAHSDVPCFKVKFDPAIQSGPYTRLSVERYGGMNMSTWMDRPLSVAGRVICQTENGTAIKLINIDRDLLMMPNAPVHLHKTDGKSYNPAVDTVPLFGMGNKDGFMKLIAEAAGVEVERILGTDLFLYNRMPGSIWGESEEFVSCRGLDDLQCTFACTEAFLSPDCSDNPASTPVLAIFDNEEVGNGTRQGAASPFLWDVIRRLYKGHSEAEIRQAMAASFLLSCDNAHAVHPNHGGLADVIHRCYLNGGIAIKHNAGQKYITDGISEAYIKLLCAQADVPWQYYSNPADVAGGSTLGNTAATRNSLLAADIGIPQLAMHSSYETTGAEDTWNAVQMLTKFFSTGYHPVGGDRYEVV
ncbi:MAG: M18 family aminopeptidase [Oscillospiraceae bacterium]|nr:M18 family aminopeptidase [Oscillospiraceae bacterium]